MEGSNWLLSMGPRVGSIYLYKIAFDLKNHFDHLNLRTILEKLNL